MHISNANIRLITINEDGSAEILFRDQTFIDVPKERVCIKKEDNNDLSTMETD